MPRRAPDGKTKKVILLTDSKAHKHNFAMTSSHICTFAHEHKNKDSDMYEALGSKHAQTRTLRSVRGWLQRGGCVPHIMGEPRNPHGINANLTPAVSLLLDTNMPRPNERAHEMDEPVGHGICTRDGGRKHRCAQDFRLLGHDTQNVDTVYHGASKCHIDESGRGTGCYDWANR